MNRVLNKINVFFNYMWHFHFKGRILAMSKQILFNWLEHDSSKVTHLGVSVRRMPLTLTNGLWLWFIVLQNGGLENCLLFLKFAVILYEFWVLIPKMSSVLPSCVKFQIYGIASFVNRWNSFLVMPWCRLPHKEVTWTIHKWGCTVSEKLDAIVQQWWYFWNRHPKYTQEYV